MTEPRPEQPEPWYDEWEIEIEDRRGDWCCICQSVDCECENERNTT